MPNLRPPVDLRVSNLRFRVLLLTYAEVWPLHESVKHICTTDHLLRSLRVDGWLRTSAKQRDGSDRLPGSIASLVYRLHSLLPEASEWRSLRSSVPVRTLSIIREFDFDGVCNHE